jgi:hypothetical protein
MELVHLIYHSKPAPELAGAARLPAFRAIHRKSVESNKRNDIGGFLILTKRHFVQLLEGDRSAVMATYERIRRDERHELVTLVDITPVRARGFSGWSMGAIHDELVIMEAMLTCGLAADADVTRLPARDVSNLLATLANKAKTLAA